MDSAQKPAAPSRSRNRFLLSGESAIASIGLSLAALLLTVMSVTVWWITRTQQSAMETMRGHQVYSVGEMLAPSIELLLQQGELTAVRRMVADAARTNHLSSCQIVLPNGKILASSKPSEASIQELPTPWPPIRATRTPPPADEQTMAAHIVLIIPGHGPAELRLTAPLAAAGEHWETAVGAAFFCVVALGLHLVLYRRVRSRLRGLGAVREALGALAAGETCIESLTINPEFGNEAVAWNNLIDEAAKLRRQSNGERARAALNRRQEGGTELDAACDTLSQGLLLVDDKCTVRYANGAAGALLSAPRREDLVGSDVAKFLQVESVLTAVRQVADGTNRRRSVFDIERREDGPAGVLRFVVRPVRREDSGTAIVTIEDITQQRVAEEARNRFVAQATHELRTPLTNIRLYVETAIENGEDDPGTRVKCLNVINGEARRLERIVGEMLSVAEIEAGSFEVHYDDVRLDQLFEELRLEYEQQALEKKIVLVFTLPPKLAVIQGDRDKMLLALHNLVGNALKYTQPNGKVEVVVNVDDRLFSVQVKDTGIGISETDQEKIFDRFYRAKDPRVAKITGTGLGLTLAREVVRLHGGDITVESRLDHGATFTLKVPVSKQVA